MQADAEQNPTLYVGVGASAGGLDAFKQLLAALPPRSRMAFILVQHLDPSHPSILSQLLAPVTHMVVKQAEHGERLRSDTVYVIPSDAALAVEEGRIDLSPPSTDRGARLSVDHLFHSLARGQGHKAVGIVLSGAGSDGSSGIRSIKTAGGLVLAQEPTSCGQASMPEAAIATGVVDLVLPIADMPDALHRFQEMPALARMEPEDDQDLDQPHHGDFTEERFERLASILDVGIGFDLRSYKAGTVGRRVHRRMGLGGFDSFDAYLEELESEPSEQRSLVQDLFISVTEFYRDEQAYQALRVSVVEPLITSVDGGDVVRAWVAGCATGEEAYSIAIELMEAAEKYGKRVAVQLFATDLDTEALAVARRGEYPNTIAELIPPHRLKKYFTELSGRGYRVRSVLRDRVSFAQHDLTRDPPFSRMDIVSCRNVLIYLRPAVQERVLKTLHFALRPDGCLFLGTSETTGSQRELYSTLSKPWRLFRKVGASRPVGMASYSRRRNSAFNDERRSRDAARYSRSGRATGMGDMARRSLMRDHVPPSLVLSEDGSVLYMHGELRPFLRFPEGEPRFDLGALVTQSLVTRTRGALFKCRRTNERVVAVTSPDAEGAGRVRITAAPAPDLGDGVVMLSFEVVEGVASTPAVETPAEESMVFELERELQATREDLRNTVQELESANEELRSTNEEAMSMNEELQSANEELEATTEELRSLNEELTTVNAQLRDKVDQVERAHDDNANFFASTRIATLFLDEHLAIQRFTPTAEELLRISHADQGRFVADIARELLQGDLLQEAQAVLEDLTPVSKEIHTSDDEWYTRRVLPYRTELRRIEGVVVTWFRITPVKRATARLERRERQQSVIAHLSMRALEETSLDAFLGMAVGSILDALGGDSCAVFELQPDSQTLLLRAGVGWSPGLVGTATVPASTRSQAGYTLYENGPVCVSNIADDKRFDAPPLLADAGMTSGVSCVIGGGDEPYGVLGVHSATPDSLTMEDAQFVQACCGVLSATIVRHDARVRSGIERSAGEAVAAATDLAQVAERLHDSLLRDLELTISELWTKDPSGRLQRSGLHTASRVDREQVVATLGERDSALLQRVASTQNAEWVTANQHVRALPRVDALQRLGVRSGLVLPVVRDEQTVAVITLFSSGLIHADVALLHSLERVGRTIGDFLRRMEFEYRYQHTVEQAPLGIAERDASGKLVRVNRRFCEITGYTRDDLLGMNEFAITLRDDLVGSRPLARRGPNEHASEKRYIRKDGTPVWVAVSESVADNGVGQPSYGIVVVDDISEKKRAEAELRESEERFRRVLVNSPALMMIYDDTDHIVAISRSWEEATGYSLAEMRTVEGWVQKVFEVPDQTAASQIARDWSKHEVEHEQEYRLRTKNGEVRTFLIRSGPLGQSHSGQRLRVAAALDITARLRIERELVEANRLKDEFMAMLGHELRNPLSAMKTASDVIRMAAPEDERITRMLGILERQSDHMARLLDGLLDISRIVHGKIALERKVVDLRALVDQAATDTSARMSGDNQLVWEVPPEPLFVDGDPVRLGQIIDNLLSNAVKFTDPPGAIHVDLELEDGKAVLTVRDEGQGIAPDLIEHLFEPFRQGEQSLDRSRGGLGLGLALVRSLTELHGGAVAAYSAGAGKGAEFQVRLPLSRRQPLTRNTGTSAPLSQRILVVEDHQDVADALVETLAAAGHEVAVCYDGASVLGVASEFDPDVVLCDIGLPGDMSGLDVARALRDDVRFASIDIIALSGYGRSDDKRRSVEAGFDAHMTKPFSLTTLNKVLRRVRAV